MNDLSSADGPDIHRSMPGGTLDGLTILRFARAFEQGGGVEGHLADLNRSLSTRNRITTIQVQLASDPSRLEPTEVRHGDSTLLTIPLLPAAGPEPPSGSLQDAGSWLSALKQAAIGGLLPTRAANAIAMEWLTKRRAIPLRGGEALGARATVESVLRRFKVDLVVLHACGGRDSSDVIDVARAAGVAVALVHHFANDRLGTISARQQVCRVAGVGGASSVGIPRYVRDVFWNLSDAVNTDFYDGAAACRSAPPSEPFIYAPGRFTPEKGQVDVVEVAHRLTQRGLRPKVVFAGRADEPAFEARLRALVAQRGLGDRVTFLGGLSLAQYRDRYCGAAVMLMPTLHGEGMPRTLIESQAMQVPPVVYDVGGTSEGVQHGVTGFLVPRGDVAAMTNAAEMLLRDEERRRAMGVAGRRFVEGSFSLAALAERHERFYTHVLGAAHAAARLPRRS